MSKKIKNVAWKTQAERKAVLKRTMQEINKRHGIEGRTYASSHKEIQKLAFDIPPLDEILGGGLPYGFFSVIWGAEACGKTSLAYYLTAAAQRADKIVYFMALEPFSAERAELFGVNLDNLTIGQFPKAEQSLDSIIELSRKKLVDVIILDSIHSLSPAREQEEKSGKEKSIVDDSMALLARKLSQFFRVALDPVKKGNILVLLIGQARMNIGFIAFENLTGGKALKQFSKLILHVRRGSKNDAPYASVKEKSLDEEGFEVDKKKRKRIGFDCTIEIDKNQISGVAPELTKIHLPYYFTEGFNRLLKEKKTSGSHSVSKTEGEGSSPSSLATPKKKKRGRPKKNA